MEPSITTFDASPARVTGYDAACQASATQDLPRIRTVTSSTPTAIADFRFMRTPVGCRSGGAVTGHVRIEKRPQRLTRAVQPNLDCTRRRRQKLRDLLGAQLLDV